MWMYSVFFIVDWIWLITRCSKKWKEFHFFCKNRLWCILADGCLRVRLVLLGFWFISSVRWIARFGGLFGWSIVWFVVFGGIPIKPQRSDDRWSKSKKSERLSRMENEAERWCALLNMPQVWGGVFLLWISELEGTVRSRSNHRRP